MSRRPNNTDMVKMTVYVPKPIYDRLALLLHDQASGRIKYGALGNLVTSLLKGWLDSGNE